MPQNLSESFGRLFTSKKDKVEDKPKSLPEGIRPKSKDVILPFNKEKNRKK